MKTIHKYTLTGASKQVITLPVGSALLNAICQHGNICIYAFVDTECRETIDLDVAIAGTGWDLTEEPLYNPKYYFKTVKEDEEDEEYVWHIFIRIPAKTLKP